MMLYNSISVHTCSHYWSDEMLLWISLKEIWAAIKCQRDLNSYRLHIHPLLNTIGVADIRSLGLLAQHRLTQLSLWGFCWIPFETARQSNSGHGNPQFVDVSTKKHPKVASPDVTSISCHESLIIHSRSHWSNLCIEAIPTCISAGLNDSALTGGCNFIRAPTSFALRGWHCERSHKIEIPEVWRHNTAKAACNILQWSAERRWKKNI